MVIFYSLEYECESVIMAAHGASTSAEDEKEKLMLSILKDIDTLGGIKDSLEYCKVHHFSPSRSR
tara:strand:+ start:2070 stop:2264 length:195 start_codon:yes stop_codon:yes gene_type:complete